MHSKSSAIRQDCRAFFAHQSSKTVGPKLRSTSGKAIFDAEQGKFARIALRRCRLAGIRRHFAVRNRRTLGGCQAVRWRSHEQSSGLFTVRFCRFAAKCGPCFWPASTLDAALHENCLPGAMSSCVNTPKGPFLFRHGRCRALAAPGCGCDGTAPPRPHLSAG